MPSQVVGVIEDVREFGPADDAPPTVYVHYERDVWPNIYLVVRAAGDPRPLYRRCGVRFSRSSRIFRLRVRHTRTSCIIERLDAVSFATTALLFLITACVAAYLPVRRASRIDPATALRSE